MRTKIFTLFFYYSYYNCTGAD